MDGTNGFWREVGGIIRSILPSMVAATIVMVVLYMAICAAMILATWAGWGVMDVTEQFLGELRDHVLALMREEGLTLEEAMIRASGDAVRMMNTAWEMLDREFFPDQYPSEG